MAASFRYLYPFINTHSITAPICQRYAPLTLTFQSLQNKCFFSTIRVHEVVNSNDFNSTFTIQAWVQAIRRHKDLIFLHVCDGSGPELLQVVIPPSLADKYDNITFGSCIKVEGDLVESEGKGQRVELISKDIDIIGTCDTNDFPIKQRQRHSPQYTRDFLHVRPKDNQFSSLLRIRNCASMAVHQYFQKEDSVFIHTPILTSSDCEGACETFKVEPTQADLMPERHLDGCDNSDNYVLSNESDHATEANDDEQKSGPKHFFNTPTYLTVSGQLHLEVMTGAMRKVYSFGPTFRAESSFGSFHLSEFYMVEAEYAFMEDLGDLLNEMENLVKYVYTSVMSSCPDDVAHYHKTSATRNYKDKLDKQMQSDFKRITYTEAIDILTRAKKNFDFKVSWGADLKKEHEMYVCKALGNVPVFVTDYPKDIKPFYARRNTDSMTVAAADLLIPKVGELCGSSLREERADVLEQAMIKHNLLDQIPWYLTLRQFGTCPHGGFGMGFERLLMAMLGAQSVKDVIPFPRWPGRCLT